MSALCSVKSFPKVIAGLIFFLVFLVLTPIILPTSAATIQPIDNHPMSVWSSSMAINSYGLPVIAESNTDAINILHCQDIQCDSSTNYSPILDNTFPLSMALTKDDVPIIAYFYYTFFAGDVLELRIANCGNPLCDNLTITPIDTTVSSLVPYVSMALDSTGLPVIVYGDPTNRGIKMARCNDLNCSNPDIKIVDSNSNFVGARLSMALTSTDIPIISYYDFNVRRIKMARCNNPVCDAPNFTYVSGVFVGNDYNVNDIALTSSDIPIIAYHDVAAQALKVTRCNNVDCTAPTTNTIAQVDDSGKQELSLSLDSKDTPNIAYISPAYELKLARCSQPTNCQSVIINTLDLTWQRAISLIMYHDFPIIYYEGNYLQPIPSSRLYNGMDSPPMVTIEHPFYVPVNTTAKITTAVLDAGDMDNAPAETITFKVTTLPQHGHLQKTTFTRNDLLYPAPGIGYTRTSPGDDSFKFTLSDGHSTVGPFTFPITGVDIVVTPTSETDVAPDINFFVGNTAVFTWRRVDGALGYKIQIDDKWDFATPLYQADVFEVNHLSYTAPSLPNGRYYWRVCAMITTTTCSGWGSPEQFIISSE